MSIVDDKSEYCIPFLIKQLELHQKELGADAPPFFLGLNGVQGAGKSTLVSALQSTLSSDPHNLQVAVLSLDDFYLRHSDQVTLASSHASNPLIQHRGQPSTHDLDLLNTTLQSLRSRKPTILPSYDKSLFSGAGDRTDVTTWTSVNAPGTPSIDLVILEGWCVGFQPLSDADLEGKWQAARDAETGGKGTGQLGKLQLEDVQFVDTALKGYVKIWELFNAFVHIDAEKTEWVYDWRLEAELKMRESKGSGMTDEQVRNFVDGYYPAYELYTETLREGIFDKKDKQMRLIIGRHRRVSIVEVI